MPNADCGARTDPIRWTCLPYFVLADKQRYRTVCLSFQPVIKSPSTMDHKLRLSGTQEELGDEKSCPVCLNTQDMAGKASPDRTAVVGVVPPSFDSLDLHRYAR